MLAGTLNLRAEQNSQESYTFVFYNEDDSADSVTERVTFVVQRSALTQSNNVFSIDSDEQVSEGYLTFPNTNETYGHIEKSGNRVTVVIYKETLSNLAAGRYYWYMVRGNTVSLKGTFDLEAL